MSKRLPRGGHKNVYSPAKRQRLDVTRESSNLSQQQQQSSSNARYATADSCRPSTSSNGSSSSNNNNNNGLVPIQSANAFEDLWGDDDFDPGDDELEELDFIASQATQEDRVFKPPQPPAPAPSKVSPGAAGASRNNGTVVVKASQQFTIVQSQMLASSSSSCISKEIEECSQAFEFDDFEKDVKSNYHNSTFCPKPANSTSNIVLVSDGEEVAKLKEENKKLLDDFMTKEGETEFLRQHLNQMQQRYEAAKKEQERIIKEERMKFEADRNELMKKNTALESELQLKTFNLNSMSEKVEILKSGSMKLAQPSVNKMKSQKSVMNASTNNFSALNSSFKKTKTKEVSTQIEESAKYEILKTSIIHYPLKIVPSCVFETAESEKSVIEIKIEEKTGKKNLAIVQDEETFRIFENPELSKPKLTTVNGKNLTTEFYLCDLAELIEKTSYEINSTECIPKINKIVATARELLLNSTLVLQKISEAMQNDDIRDMNELYMSEFYELPVSHTHNFCEAKAWYDLERGVETRRAVGLLSHLVSASDYLADYVCGNRKLQVKGDKEFESYAKQMNSYNSWYRKGCTYEFLDLIVDFVTIVGTIRRSHQFTGLLIAIMTLISNVQHKMNSDGIRRIFTIVKEITFSRPLLSTFISLCKTMKVYSLYPSFANKFCVAPKHSGITYWSGSPHFTKDACTIEVLIAQLENFKLDPVTMIHITMDLTRFSNVALINKCIPWLEQTIYTCNCCLKLLKFVLFNLCECSKINVGDLKEKYVKTENSIVESNSQLNKVCINVKKELQKVQDWEKFEERYKGHYWKELTVNQYTAISNGIKLISYLAKRDLDFMIRMHCIEDAFHLFLRNLNSRKDITLSKSDEIALDLVKKTFVLEKREENKVGKHEVNMVKVVSESWSNYQSKVLRLSRLFEKL
ncbi:uncharacterized protein LOC106653517 [Trichogramma pretiosum]|uniref:uncharacterized protein LOC106653517 n=1 Tax=Trichogramma pretiosum TaxID=7493 RepID=UPI0006C98D60|nr:uncharacterized protein LOC106653517 [Trichogramma pretiosum]